MRVRHFVVLWTLMGASLFGQAPAATAPSPMGNPFDQLTRAELQTRAAAMLTQAQASPSGMSSVTLQKYPGHFTMLTVRTRSGGAEQHDHASDFFFVLDGEATEVVGGSIPNSKASKPGELRGPKVVGGVEHVMRPGDIIHISPGTPHQTLVAPGKSFTYFVIKVEQ